MEVHWMKGKNRRPGSRNCNNLGARIFERVPRLVDGGIGHRCGFVTIGWRIRAGGCRWQSCRKEFGSSLVLCQFGSKRKRPGLGRAFSRVFLVGSRWRFIRLGFGMWNQAWRWRRMYSRPPLINIMVNAMRPHSPKVGTEKLAEATPSATSPPAATAMI